MRSLLMALAVLVAAGSVGGNVVKTDASGVLLIDGRRMFVVSVAMPPPAEGKTPGGKGAMEELGEAGVNFLRVPAPEGAWSEGKFGDVQGYFDALAKSHMYGWIALRELATPGEGAEKREATLRALLTRFKDHPAMGGYKGVDEPAWGKQKIEPMERGYRVIHEVDPNHPVCVLHAPKGENQTLVPYMPYTDVTGADVFPIGYPPGKHPGNGNTEISSVADYTKWCREVAGGKPVWMTLQIAFSGTGRPGKTLRFPTYEQLRYMTYAAIVNGARGVNYFGGSILQTLNERDRALGWNWTFWERVLRPIVEEVGEKSPLWPALVAPDSRLDVKCDAKGVEYCVREAGGGVYVIATRRDHETTEVRFSGLPVGDQVRELLFESPRKVEVKGGEFKDWFGPFEVHVYRFER